MTEEAQESEFSIHWIEDVVQEVLQRNDAIYLMSTGKSPSGSIHIGIMRELIITDVIKRELLKKGKNARTMFVVDDYDPIRSFPPSVSLSIDEWSGIPYSDIPDEFGCCESFGAHWANELVDTFSEFGVDHEVVYTSKIYEKPEMLEAVRTCLKQTETIREIMIEYVAKDFNDEQKEQYIKSMENWFPASVVCPKCGRLQAGIKGSIAPNRITSYNPKSDEITFDCLACGHHGIHKLTEVRVKLTWRMDWPAKWHVFQVSCEPAGKDHAVKGGSYDTGLEVSRRVFQWSGPVKVPYEWVRIGGRDMSTSSGIVFNPKTWLSIAPPELYRYILLKSDLNRAINIQPEKIPDMVDEYDRFERTFYGIEEVDDERMNLVKIVYPLSTAKEVSKEYIPKLPFKFAVVTSQLEDLLGSEIILERCRQVLKKQYNLDEVPQVVMDLVPTRLERARNWVKMFGTQRDLVEIPDKVPEEILKTLTDTDRKFLSEIIGVLRESELDDDAIQSAVFEKARLVDLKDKRAFIVLYRILISRKSGPRLGSFLNLLGLDWVANRIESIL
ncbi:MAG: lysine--tRNA ligase [Candidatus Thorarchaeota archaeon]